MRWTLEQLNCSLCEANVGCPTHPKGRASPEDGAFLRSFNERPEVQGVKYDDGKPDHTYISNDLLDGLAAVREFGCKHKRPAPYPRDNWRKGFKFNRSLAAAYRHLNAFKEGEDLDKESGLSHILHAVACLEHLLGDYLHRPHNDDRYKPSKSQAADTIKE